MSNFNFNRVIIGGRITANLELKLTQSNIPVCAFTVAVNRRTGKTKDGETAEPQADFINVVAWRQQAEFVTRYFGKGSSICVVGQIQTRRYQDKDGNNRTATEVVADEIQFVDSKGESTQTAPEPVQFNSINQVSNQPSYIPDAYKQTGFTDMQNDDDLPF